MTFPSLFILFLFTFYITSYSCRNWRYFNWEGVLNWTSFRPSAEVGRTFMVVFVFSGVCLSNHGPHWLQAAKQSLQKTPAPWLEPNVLRRSPDCAGLWTVPRLGPATTLAGLMFMEFQHTVVKVGWRSITGTGAATNRTPLSTGVYGQYVTEDTLRGGQVRFRGASRSVSIESSIGRFWDGGAEAWQGRGRGVGLMKAGPTHQGVPQHSRLGRMKRWGEHLQENINKHKYIRNIQVSLWPSSKAVQKFTSPHSFIFCFLSVRLSLDLIKWSTV